MKFQKLKYHIELIQLFIYLIINSFIHQSWRRVTSNDDFCQLEILQKFCQLHLDD